MEKRFIFRGNAVGVAGHMHAPEDLIIWVHGASTLPVIGGYSQSTVERMKVTDLIRAEHIRTQATGDFSPKENAYITLARSVVRGLDFKGRLTVDTIEATLTSTHPAAGGEPRIVSTGTQIKNLRIDGYPVEITLDNDLFTKYATKESLSNAYASDDAFFKRYGARFEKSETDKKTATTTKRKIPEPGGYIVTSIVSQIQTKHPKAVVEGNMIILNDFGRIFVGELLITSASRRLTLLRLKLGSPDKGESACGEVESNGSGII